MTVFEEFTMSGRDVELVDDRSLQQLIEDYYTRDVTTESSKQLLQ